MKKYTATETCIVCSTIFLLANNRKGKAKYCSKKCMSTVVKVPTPIGKRYSRLVVLREVDPEIQFSKGRPTKLRKVECQCDCGKTTVTRLNMLYNKETRSCGCLKYEQDEKNLNEREHLLSNHRLYSTWSNMMARCYKKNCKAFKSYGGRGIKVCERWKNITNFIEDMYPTYVDGLEIEREDNDGHYEPSNCSWQTKSVQANNRRTTIRVLYNGEKMALVYACEKAGVDYNTLYRIIRKHKINFEEALIKSTELNGSSSRNKLGTSDRSVTVVL